MASQSQVPPTVGAFCLIDPLLPCPSLTSPMLLLGLFKPSPHLQERRHPIAKLRARRVNCAKAKIYWASMQRSVRLMPVRSQVVRSPSQIGAIRSVAGLISCLALAERLSFAGSPFGEGASGHKYSSGDKRGRPTATCRQPPGRTESTSSSL